MRIAVLADIHGNLPALEAVLADAERHQASRFIVAGDFTGGPQPQLVTDRLRDLPAWIIRGNGEEYCINLYRGDAPAGWGSSRQWAATRWSYRRLTTETLAWLAALPAELTVTLDTTEPIRVVHGSPTSSREHLYPDRDSVAMAAYGRAGLKPAGSVPQLGGRVEGVSEPILVCAHSHIPWQQREKDCLVVNPGSAGGSNSGDWRAQYALLEWDGDRWQVTLRSVVYDRSKIRAAYRDSGFLNAGGAFACACLLATESGENIAGWLVDHAYRLAETHRIPGGATIPDPIWDQAADTFDWTRVDSPTPFGY